MSRGTGKTEEKPLSDLTQALVNHRVIQNKLDNYQKFVNQLLDVVKSTEGSNLLWLNEFPKEIKEENLVHLLNVVRQMITHKSSKLEQHPMKDVIELVSVDKCDHTFNACKNCCEG